jgi:hypothetical protein
MVWVVLLILLSVVLVLAVKRLSGGAKRVLTANLVSQGPQGFWHVNFSLETMVVARIELCLLWACKLRWLLNSDPEHVRVALGKVVGNLAEAIAADTNPSSYGPLYAQIRALRFVGIGDTLPGVNLNLHLYYHPRGPVFWFLNNNFPRRATFGDLIWSVVVLTETIFPQLAPQNRQLLAAGLVRLSEIFSQPEANDPSLANLSRLYQMAHAAIVEAGLDAMAHERTGA